jgi:hypothetical protein
MEERKPHHEPRALAHVELAAIDPTISAMQAAGVRVGDVGRDDNPRQQMADAWADAHHPFVDLTEHDREILGQIKRLAAQLQSRVTLQKLVDVYFHSRHSCGRLE